MTPTSESFNAPEPRRRDALGNLWQHEFHGSDDPIPTHIGGTSPPPFFGEAGPVPAADDAPPPFSPADLVGFATESQLTPAAPATAVPVRPPQSPELLRATAELYFNQQHRRLPVPAPKEPAFRAEVELLEAEYAAEAAGPIDDDGDATPQIGTVVHNAETVGTARPVWMAPSARLLAVVISILACIGGAVILFVLGR